jgi:hypothetical protein
MSASEPLVEKLSAISAIRSCNSQLTEPFRLCHVVESLELPLSKFKGTILEAGVFHKVLEYLLAAPLVVFLATALIVQVLRSIKTIKGEVRKLL